MPFRPNPAHDFCPVICAPSMRSADAGNRMPASFSCNAASADILPCSPFKYIESRTGKALCRTGKGEDFLWQVLQHVLPKGFRRARDYGFLHGNAKQLLPLVQLVLQVLIQACALRTRPAFKYPKCQSPICSPVRAALWPESGEAHVMC